jgi:hypothetical protein
MRADNPLSVRAAQSTFPAAIRAEKIGSEDINIKKKAPHSARGQ